MPVLHQSTTVLGELFLLWWIIIVIDFRGLLNDRAFFFAPFLFLSALLGLSAKFLQALRPDTPVQEGSVRLPEDDQDVHIPNCNTVHNRKEELKKIVSKLDTARVVTVAVTIATQLAFFIVLMVMKNGWFRYQLPRDILLVNAVAILVLVLPSATFMHKLHWVVPSFFTLVFLGTFFFSLFIFPFTSRSPAYLEFSQIVNLDTGTNVVRLTGPSWYTDQQVVPFLPSWKRSEDLHECHPLTEEQLRGQPESSYCLWHGLAPPTPPSHLLIVHKLTMPSQPGIVQIWVKYSPECTGYGLEFTSPTQPRWEGISRSEDRNNGVTEHFKVWVPEESTWTARVSCVWHDVEEEEVPAFTEVKYFEPHWARVGLDRAALITAERFLKIQG